jgi:lipoprotein-anchoring transpeptidase ErfK/SrfK
LIVAAAAGAGDLDLLRNFLARSHRPEAIDADGLSAAHHAMRARKFDSFQLIWARMAETGTAGAAGPGLLSFALTSGDMPAIRSVVSRLNTGLEWTKGTRDALKFALTSGDLELTRTLLSLHPAPPTAEGKTVPLLAQAMVDGDASTFRALLAAGADPNTTLPTPSEKRFVAQVPSADLRGYVRADRGITVLMLAAGLGKGEYLRALLDAGADRNRQSARYKMLALYFAAHTQEPKCVQMLLGRGPTREQLRVEISLATQRASVIKDGVSILQTSVSTGRKGFDTPAGEYVITDKNRNHVSSVYHVEMPFFMRLNCRDFGMHAGNVPNYPASHGCIRLPADVAAKLFSEIPVGTVVTIN